MIKPAQLLLTTFGLTALSACADMPKAAQVTAPVTPAEATFSGTAIGSMVVKTDPRYRQLGAAGPYYPERAVRMNVHGYAVIACHVAPDQSLADCRILTEAPADFGFGIAAVYMAKNGWMKAALPDAQEPHTPDGWVLARVDYMAPAP